MINQSRQGISVRGAYRRSRKHVHLRTSARGSALLQVLGADGGVVHEQTVKNIVLNVGIEALKTRSWAANMEACVLGTGVKPTVEPGGSAEMSQSGQTLTIEADGDFTFNADLVSDVGKIIKWTSGERARIISVSSITSATAFAGHSQTVPVGTFSVYSTQQTISDMVEAVRVGASGYHTDGGGCGTSIVGNVITHRRTFNFPAETGSRTYTEAALSHSATPGAQIFSRIKLDTGLSVVALQSVRVVYNLELTVEPDLAVAKAVSIDGWPVAPATDTQGDEMIQLLGYARINPTTGATEENASVGLSLEPYAVGSNCAVFLSNSAAPLSDFGTAADRTGTGTAVRTDVAIDPATSSLYEGYLEKVAIFPEGEAGVVSDGNASYWRSFGIGKATGGAHPYVVSGFVFVFDQAQTKDHLHTLELRFSYAWAQAFS